MKTDVKILVGDCLDSLRGLPDESVHCVVTSPPYWGLRDYGVEGQIGLEPTLEEFIRRLVDVFAEVHRVLRKDGTCWVNMGDGYSDKQVVGQPWRLAFALQADRWLLRQDIIWHKPNPMPESIQDRCTKSHEYLFLLTKSPKYFWDFDAMKEPVTGNAHARGGGVNAKIKQPDGWASQKGAHGTIHKDGREKGATRPKQNASFSSAVADLVESRNRRSVWTIPSEPCSDAHFATFPTALVRPCILAGCPIGGTVLDPFGGSGTTAVVALELSRSAILCELNPEYVEIARRRIAAVTPGLPL